MPARGGGDAVTEFVVHSARGEAVVRTSSEREARRMQRILGGHIDQVTTPTIPEPTVVIGEELAA